MPSRTQFSRRRSERGQTIVLVAISIVSLLAIAALAIDVVTLYVARGEIQHAADAAALAGVKAIADSGITSLSSADLAANSPAVQLLATSMATQAINAVLLANSVAGNQPTWMNQPLVIDYRPTGTTIDNNPHVTITLQQSNLPTFFARIFGRTLATVTASATAEAYNPANSSPFTEIAPRCVKPWLIANSNPGLGAFIDPISGAVNTLVIGLTYDLTSDCTGGGICTPLTNSPPTSVSDLVHFPRIQYVPAVVAANPANVCSTSCSGTAYQDSISCCDANSYSYLSCGPVGNIPWDNTVDPGAGGKFSQSATAAECLIHATAAGPTAGQDTLDQPTTPWPANAPFKITAGGGPQFGNHVATSSSIVTIPILDVTPAKFPPAGGAVFIVGFLQAFINCVEDGTNPNCGNPTTRVSFAGDINITVLNIVGCGSSPSAASPVIGGNGTSPIPVRLITPP